MNNQRLIQYRTAEGESCVARVIDEARVQALDAVGSVYDLAWRAIDDGGSLSQAADTCAADSIIDYEELLEGRRLLPPITHADPAHLIISGTGLTHLGSADTRDAMHAKLQADPEDLSDSMKMFRMGLENGKPSGDATGVQPEWFYKGDGSILVPPERPFRSPGFALDGGEEPEICGIYVIGPAGTPFRLGFALGNEFSDHKLERINYLYLAHSKLRQCAVGPELRIGPLPSSVTGISRILRNGEVAWEKPFLSGEDNMSHSIANLEYHHFKYKQFLRPGDVHIHFFGTGTLSFGDGFETEAGDVFEISATGFGRPLRNGLEQAPADAVRVTALL